MGASACSGKISFSERRCRRLRSSRILGLLEAARAVQASQARIRGSESVSDSMMQRIHIPHFLDVATYVSVAAMSVLGISGLSSLPLRLLALGLVLIFGLLYHFVFRSGRYERSPNLYLGVQAVTLGLLFLVGSDNSDAFQFPLCFTGRSHCCCVN